MDLEYYNGSALFYSYLCYNAGDFPTYSEFMKKEHYINYAITSLIAVFFTSQKEEIVDKEDGNNFSSKIIDEELAKSILTIAEYKNGKYYIGDYEEENPANIIALIRNKFAHGEYEIDPYHNKIILFRKDGNVELDIKKLSILINMSVCNLIVLPKTDRITRIQPQNRNVLTLGITQAKNKDDIRLMLKTSFLKEYTLYTYDKSNISEEVLTIFNKLLNKIKELADDDEKINFLIAQFNKLANKEKKNLTISKKRLKEKDFESIVNIIEHDKEFYTLPLYAQLRYILTLMCEYQYPEYQKEGYLGGLIINLSILNGMKDSHLYEIDKIFNEQEQMRFLEVMEQCFTSSLLANFNSAYIHPLERKYATCAYKVDRSEELDFSLLDLSFINPTTITIYENQLEEITLRYNNKIDQLLNFKNHLLTLNQSLNKSKLKNNQKGINYLENEIKNKRIELVDFLNEFKIVEDEYKKIKRDYIENPKYFYNRAIIEGIRNSIAHGNVRIKKFISSGSIDDVIINFKDIYEGKLTFEANITIKQFQQFFNENNLKVLLAVSNKKEKTNKKSNEI